MCPEHKIIIGANVYYDALDSSNHRHYDQAGLGFEILTEWVDFRFNYYLPDQKRERISHRSVEHSKTVTSSEFRDERGFIDEISRDTSRRLEFASFEAPLEGWNSELGFLVPGLDQYLEMRVFGGYYHYLNPFGSDFEGFKARLEARMLPGVIADVEWWDDASLTGGHWTGGARVSVPFTLGNLFTGKNPFEGASEMFRPRKREFRERMSEMVIRSHRVMTTGSGEVPIGGSSESSQKVVQLREERHDAIVAVAPPTDGGGDGGGDNGGKGNPR
jgi:hypothetical protein